jgi:polysaccharide export outer membrane protein
MAFVAAGCVPAVPIAPAAQPSARGASQWLVEPGDVIRLRTWLAPEQSGDLLVNDEGKVLLPLVGRVAVGGLKPDAVYGAVVQSYEGRLDPSKVEITFLRPVSVLGGVKLPSVQLADPSATVLSLITRSGGPTHPGGDLHAYVLRVGEPTHEISLADRVSDLGIRSSDQLYVQDPPFVVRNETAIRSVFEVLQLIGTTLTIVFLVNKK